MALLLQDKEMQQWCDVPPLNLKRLDEDDVNNNANGNDDYDDDDNNTQTIMPSKEKPVAAHKTTLKKQ
jgi:hypothetical protein